MRPKFRTVLAVLLGTLALSAVASTPALAASTNNPQWNVAKAILGTGQSEAVEVSQNGAQLLNWFGETIRCGKLKAETPAAKILGSNTPNAGTGEETLVFEECEVEGFSNCKINKENGGTAKIKTNPLKSTLIFETKAGAESEGGQTLTLLQPQSGLVVGMIEFSGECGTTGLYRLEGQVAAVNVKGGEELASHELRFPEPRITKYFVNEAGKTVEKKVKELTLAGISFRWFGGANLKLASKKLWNIVG